MPLRLMTWNISRFNVATITPAPAGRADFNEWYIVETVAQRALDLFVVVEVQTNQGLVGALISGAGLTGVLELLASLRDEEPAADWHVVPPVKLNDNVLGPAYTEGIAVYFRNATLEFTGPYWYGGLTATPNQNAAQDYPAAWNGALPAGNKRAGQISFSSGGRTLSFPSAGRRPPLFTTFRERGNNRVVRLLSVHLPPDQSQAAQALSQIDDITELQIPANATDVAIVAGDVNYDLGRADTTTVAQNRYDLFRGAFHFRGFTTAQGPTRIEDVPLAEPTLLVDGYTRYQKVKPPNSDNLRLEYLDNVYLRYGVPPGPPNANYNPLVVDRVAGSAAYPCLMSDSLARIRAYPHGNQTDLFREWQNYGQFARPSGVSDHLPIVVDVP